MGKILTSLALAGVVALGIGGCKDANPEYWVKAEQNYLDIGKRFETKLEKGYLIKSIVWTRYPTCSQEVREKRELRNFPGNNECKVDGQWRYCGNLGEELDWTLVDDEDKVFNILHFYKHGCDKNIDVIYDSKVHKNFTIHNIKSYFRTETKGFERFRELSGAKLETEELFDRVNKLFENYKDELREGVDIELETQKWLDSLGKLYLDLETPDLPLIESGSTLKQVWTDNDLGNLGEARSEDTPYAIKGKINNISPSLSAIYTVKCNIVTDKILPQFTARLKPDGSFSGTVYLAPKKELTNIELILKTIEKTGRKSKEIGTFTLRIE